MQMGAPEAILRVSQRGDDSEPVNRPQEPLMPIEWQSRTVLSAYEAACHATRLLAGDYVFVFQPARTRKQEDKFIQQFTKTWST